MMVVQLAPQSMLSMDLLQPQLAQAFLTLWLLQSLLLLCESAVCSCRARATIISCRQSGCECSISAYSMALILWQQRGCGKWDACTGSVEWTAYMRFLQTWQLLPEVRCCSCLCRQTKAMCLTYTSNMRTTDDHSPYCG